MTIAICPRCTERLDIDRDKLHECHHCGWCEGKSEGEVIWFEEEA